MEERDYLFEGISGGTFYTGALESSSGHKRKRSEMLTSIIRSEEQVWEESSQGLLKHMVNRTLGTNEFAVEIYQQGIPPRGYSGRHRHYSEEVIFVIEGSGFDLHWDPVFDAHDSYEWRWQDDPQRFDWKAGDFIYVPPLVAHQHFAGGSDLARLVCATSRVTAAMMGDDGLEQLANADGSSLSTIRTTSQADQIQK